MTFSSSREHLVVGQVVVEDRVRVLFRVGRVDAVHPCGFDQYLDAQLLAPQGRGGVGGHERAARAGGQDDDPSLARCERRGGG